MENHSPISVPHLAILYQDENMIAVNKPNDMAVHASRMYVDDTVFVLQTLRDQIQKKVFPAHRLDRKTSGVLLFALNDEMNSTLQKMFAENKIHKTYHAIVRGHLKEKGTIDYALKNDAGKIQEAITDFSPISFYEINVPLGKHPSSRYTLVELKPATGRFHQLRKHMAHIFHPIIGDRPHGCNKQNRLWKDDFKHKSMLLHAHSIRFSHPITQDEIVITAPYSQPFLDAFSILENKKI